jgi:hypothetical protein
MADAKEDCINEAHFQYDAVKSLQVSDTKAKITIEIDLSQAIKDIAIYDAGRYNILQDKLSPDYLAKIIAQQLDWRAYALSINDDHELAHILSGWGDI